jgi:hypothetical protein
MIVLFPILPTYLDGLLIMLFLCEQYLLHHRRNKIRRYIIGKKDFSIGALKWSRREIKLRLMFEEPIIRSFICDHFLVRGYTRDV